MNELRYAIEYALKDDVLELKKSSKYDILKIIIL